MVEAQLPRVVEPGVEPAQLRAIRAPAVGVAEGAVRSMGRSDKEKLALLKT